MPRAFALRIVLPTLVSAALFVVAIFFILLPSLEESILERKREMIRELTNSAWNILANLEQQAKDGRMSREEAQASAVKQIRNLHYGPHMKDYFWINDMQPRMVVHPYRRDLDGQDLTEFRDPTGKRMFVEMADVVRQQGAGYVSYHWQWKDDPEHIVPKLSYVKGFAPWGWIIGTGIYLEDVKDEISQVTRRLASWSSAILAAVTALLLLIVRESWNAERSRRAAEAALRDSEERYRTLVESAGESILMVLEDDHLYANASACAMLGYETDELRRLSLPDLVPPEEGLPDLPLVASRRDVMLRRKDGTELAAHIAFSPIRVGDKNGCILVATDITERKRAEQALGKSEASLREQVATLRDRVAEREAALEELRMAMVLLQPAADVEPSFRFLDQIRHADSPAEIARLNQALPGIVRSMSENGASSALVNRLITLNTDAVVERLIDLAVQELGPPPAAFTFLIMGSEGRREQTLRTDQDNAIVFADVPEPNLARALDYFGRLGSGVCEQLHRAGYAYCERQVMASNPALCQPLSVWKRMFGDWIDTLEAEDLLSANIFFDFRAGYGDAGLADELRRHLYARLDNNPRFFTQLARSVLHLSPPVGVFGQFHTESSADGRKVLSIKSAMIPIVDFARIYALRHRIEVTNTIQRLEGVRDRGVISPQSCQEICEVYAALMQIRISGQVRAVAAGRPPDNLIEPARISYLEQRILKESFAQIRHFQTRLAYDFTGMSEVPA